MKKKRNAEWRVKLRILIEVAHGCKTHFAQSLWGSWGWQCISVVQPARVNIILPYTEHILRDVFVLFCRFGVWCSFFVLGWMEMYATNKHRVRVYEFGDFPLCSCMCVCLFLVMGSFSLVWVYVRCLKLCRLLACCRHRHHQTASLSLNFCNALFVFYIFNIPAHTK